MDGYSYAMYLTSGLVISELKDDGYYVISDGESSDTVYMSEAAVRELIEHFTKPKEAEREATALYECKDCGKKDLTYANAKSRQILGDWYWVCRGGCK